ncbi:MAG: DUF1349 domain-containing protein, partial [Frankiaceae bacterium]|nr:DUF1349 domain-containing protein [Frankiaceae bacterium]
MTATAAYRSQQAPGRDGFAQALRAEWTKLRSVRGWVGGLAAAGLLAVLIGVLTAIGGSISCSPGPGGPTLSGAACRQTPPLGPGGDIVSDSFYFVHQTMTGDGSITARLTGLSGQYANSGAIQANPGPSGGSVTGLSNGVQPWSKAGIIIKADTTQGSPYVAMMVTGGNGVRMQYNFAHDIAGMAGQVSPAAPRWLRLTRTGDLITGYDSADGATWAKVGAVKLPGLPGSAPAGLFAASPNNSVAGGASFIGSGVSSGPTTATGAF